MSEPRFKVTKEKTGKHTTTVRIEPGVSDLGNETVVCDDCSKDFTDSDERGGILFQSKAIGPCCAQRWIDGAALGGELDLIRRVNPTSSGVSFAAWVREVVRQ